MSGSNVRVVCRFRPETEADGSSNDRDGKSTYNSFSDSAVNLSSRVVNLVSRRPGGILKSYEFEFDRVFPPEATQLDIYKDTGESIAASVMQGYNGTILAYGQTASGKTYTMEGPEIPQSGAAFASEDAHTSTRGLTFRMCAHIFSGAAERISVSVSVIEIYLEKILDLMEPKKKLKCSIKEDPELGIYVKGAAKRTVRSIDDVIKTYRRCSRARKTASTAMNYASSRSHCITILEVKRLAGTKCTVGKLFLVDLAGSEKVGKARLKGARLAEAKKINKSLTMLGIVINALGTKEGAHHHVPYRDSKLTRILQESLGGNAKTALILCCSPSQSNCWETLSTLRFGCRAKRVTNAAVVNTKMNAAELTEKLNASLRRNRELENKVKEIAKRLMDSNGEVAGDLSYGNGTLLTRAQELFEARETVAALKSQLQESQRLYEILDARVGEADASFARDNSFSADDGDSSMQNSSNVGDDDDAMNGSKIAAAPQAKFYYKDESGATQGPFLASDMKSWFLGGYLGLELLVKRDDDDEFAPLRNILADKTFSEDDHESDVFLGNGGMRAYSDEDDDEDLLDLLSSGESADEQEETAVSTREDGLLVLRR